MTKMREVLEKTDWAFLAQQKLALLAIDGNPAIDGLLHFLDAIQDAAAAEGFPVVWLDGSTK